MSRPSVFSRLCLGLSAVMIVLTLSGCGTTIRTAQPGLGGAMLLQSDPAIGQTFTSHFAGLNGVELYMAPKAAGDGEARLTVWPRMADGAIGPSPVATATLPLNAVTRPGYYRFSFSPLPDSRMRDYFLSAQIEGDGALDMATSSPNMYLDGAAYASNAPADAQLTFQLTFDRAHMWLGYASLGIEWLRLLFIAVLMLVLPGWVITSFAWRASRELPWPSQLSLAIGVSTALYPILTLLSLIGLRLGALGTWLIVGVGIVGSAWRLWRWARGFEAAPRWRSVSWADAATLGLIVLIVGSRFVAISTIDFPMFGDSYQHTMMAQLVADNAGLFDSWLPYAELSSFTYHYGYHALVAHFHWLSGLAMPQANLWMGQILNALAVIALGVLAGKVARSRWAVPTTLLIAGLLSSMPMFYLNWGRYTQLAGQVVLPAAIFACWMALEGQSRGRDRAGLVALGVVLMGSLALIHYRILIFAVLFVPAFALLHLRQLLPQRVAGRWYIPVSLINIVAIGIGGGLIFAPWFLRTFQGRITTNFGIKLATPAQAVTDYQQAINSVTNLSDFLPIAVWLLMVVAIGAALWQRNRSALTYALWWGFILLAANPAWLSLPGTGALSNFAVFIAAYMPAAVLIGTLCDAPWADAARSLLNRHVRTASAVAALGLIGLGAWGALQRQNDVNVALGTLVTRPDQMAAAWLRQNTPPDARLLVNSFSAYGNSSIVGSDGGWWLPLIAGRLTNVPPLTYSVERGATPDFQQRVNALSAQVNEKGLSDVGTLQLLREHGITHVYVGQRQGRSNNVNGPALDVQQLMANPALRPVYHQDRVWVFALQP